MMTGGGPGSRFKIQNKYLREFLAEFLGTLVLVIIGNGSIAQAVLSLNTKGNFFSVNFGWGIGIFLGVMISGGVSGGHLNPAITVSLAVVGRFPWRKVPHYLLAQYLGALVGACLVFFLYWDALIWYEHQHGVFRSVPDTAAIFATFPSPHLSHLGGVGDQVLATALLAISICTVTDRRNIAGAGHTGSDRANHMMPGMLGLTVLGLGVSLGFNCGYPLNPARDLAPRLFMVLTGWGVEVFSSYNHWWIIPIVSCHLGAILGACSYLALVELHWPQQNLQQHSDHHQHHHQHQQQQQHQRQSLTEAKLPSLTKPGFGSNFLNYSNLYHQNELTEKDVGGTLHKKPQQSSVLERKNFESASTAPEVMYSVVKKPKKSKASDHQQSTVVLSVHEPYDDTDLFQQQEDEISLGELFPDPADFVPPSPTFTFPPLPPTPPDNEITETETVTESTGRTEIEVTQFKPDLIQFCEKKNSTDIKVFQDVRKNLYSEPLETQKSKQNSSRSEKKKNKVFQHQLALPTVQITAQGSSEREIMDSIALTKNKLDKKEVKHTSRSSKKNKRRKEKKENKRPATAEPVSSLTRREKSKEFCARCHEKKMRRRMEREREREIMMRSEEQIVYDPEEPFVDRHIEEAEVLRRYIDPDKVYDDTISIKSYCVCSLHAEDRVSPFKLSQQKLEQVRDAVLVVRNWKHSKEVEK